MTMIILETCATSCGLWDIDYNSDNWEPEFRDHVRLRNTKHNHFKSEWSLLGGMQIRVLGGFLFLFGLPSPLLPLLLLLLMLLLLLLPLPSPSTPLPSGLQPICYSPCNRAKVFNPQTLPAGQRNVQHGRWEEQITAHILPSRNGQLQEANSNLLMFVQHNPHQL